MFEQELGIDLGSSKTIIVTRRRGITTREPSVVAVNRTTKSVIAYGDKAQQMIGRTPQNIECIRPVQGGVVSDPEYTTTLLRHLIRARSYGRWFRPQVVMAVRAAASEVNRRALANAALQAGAAEIHLVNEMVAAALGAELPVEEPVGSLLVDIGSGTTGTAVISLGGVVVSDSTTAAGTQMDEAIARHMKREHNLLIGTPTAERIKIEHGAALPDAPGQTAVPGRLLTIGAPAILTIDTNEIYSALADCLAQIDAMIISVLERTPPELLADISHEGIVLTGGGSLLSGLPERLSKVTGLPVRLAEFPIDAVALGTLAILEKRPRVKLTRVRS